MYGLKVITTENGIGEINSNFGRGCLYLVYTNAFWKDMNPFLPVHCLDSLSTNVTMVDRKER